MKYLYIYLVLLQIIHHFISYVWFCIGRFSIFVSQFVPHPRTPDPGDTVPTWIGWHWKKLRQTGAAITTHVEQWTLDMELETSHTLYRWSTAQTCQIDGQSAQLRSTHCSPNSERASESSSHAAKKWHCPECSGPQGPHSKPGVLKLISASVSPGFFVQCRF